jgi:hypothetical protein
VIVTAPREADDQPEPQGTTDEPEVPAGEHAVQAFGEQAAAAGGGGDDYVDGFAKKGLKIHIRTWR